MRKTALFALLTAFALTGGATTYAHHAVQAQFDVTKNLILSGMLKKVDWTNPHAWFHFDVKGAGRRGHGNGRSRRSVRTGCAGSGISDRRLFLIGDELQDRHPSRSLRQESRLRQLVHFPGRQGHQGRVPRGRGRRAADADSGGREER